MSVNIEICVGSLSEFRAASQSAVNAIELCTALEVGGLTPSLSMVQHCLALTTLPIRVMVRPRSGNFNYDADEQRIILFDLERLKQAGVRHFVLGACTAEGVPDFDFLSACSSVIGDSEFTYHRAIDLHPTPESLIATLREVGVNRILSSGGNATAEAGTQCLRRMVEHSEGLDLHICAASGINANNSVALVQQTKVPEIHFSARKMVVRQVPFSSALHGADFCPAPEKIVAVNEQIKLQQ